MDRQGIEHLRSLCFITFFLLSNPAFAIRPFITDDARVVGDKLAQVESWMRADQSSFQHWALPAYGPTRWLEVSAGGFHGFSNGEYSWVAPLFQVKALLRETNSDDFPGVAIATGIILSTGSGPFRLDGHSPYVYIALTDDLFHEKILTHVNIGIVKVPSHTHSVVTWGVGQQIKVSGPFHIIFEVVSGDPYNEEAKGGGIQLGFRYLFSEDVQFDSTFGTGLWGDPRLPTWGSAGIRIVFQP